MVTKEQSDRLVQMMKSAYLIVRTLEEIKRWIKFGKTNIKLLRKFLKNSNNNIGEKIRIQSTVVQLLALSERFENKKRKVEQNIIDDDDNERVIIGGNINQNNDNNNNTNRNLRNRIRWRDVDNIFNGNIRTGMITNLTHRDLIAFLQDVATMLLIRLRNIMRRVYNLKVHTVLQCEFEALKDDVIVRETFSFNTKSATIQLTTNLEEWFEINVQDRLLTKIEEFNLGGSGWSLIKIDNITITISNFQPLRGGESTYCKLPQKLLDKKAIINIQNDDPYCFLWSVVAALSPKVEKNPHRTSNYPHFSRLLKYDGISFPMVLNDIPKFEKMNNLKINVYTSESSECVIVPVYLSDHVTDTPTIHLFILNCNKKKKK